jgi:hypothetical protein
MVTRRQARALESRIEELESEIEAYKSMGDERDAAIKLLREHAEAMPPESADRVKLQLALADLTDSLHSRKSS